MALKQENQMEWAQPEKPHIFQIPVLWFGVIAIIILIAMYTGNLPEGMIGALLVMMVLGELLGWIGDKTPVVRSFLGGGAMLSIFGAAIMVHLKLMPTETASMVEDFMLSGGFLDFYIAALICGSILGINAKMLIKIGVRFALPLLSGVLLAILFGGVIGMLLQPNIIDTVLNIVLPIMGGGMGTGGIPMSQMYSETLGNDPSYYISLLVPAIALANLFSIVLASILNIVGKKYPHLTGDGQLMKGVQLEEEPKDDYDIGKMGVGIVAAMVFFIISQLLGNFIPIHPYAILIIFVALVKVLNIIPESIITGVHQWYRFVAKNWTYALLIGIGIVFTDISAVLSALTLNYILIVGSVVLGAAIGAGFVGKWLGLYPIEAAITAGLSMSNMGGTGDVSVLAAAKRMKLIPYSQISSTLGAAIILLLAGLIMKLN